MITFSSILRLLRRGLRLGIVMLVASLLMGRSDVSPGSKMERARAFTRSIEFDYVNWMLDALLLKINHGVLGGANYLSTDVRHQTVLDYLHLVTQIYETEAQLSLIYADPNVTDPEAASAEVRVHLAGLNDRRDHIAPVAEAILQDQIAQVAADMGLAPLGGQTMPPVLYHTTPLPWALIISPRDVIRQDADISLTPDLAVDQHAALEAKVDQAMNVSSLVVGIGGVGVYPTMVQQTNSLDWMSEVVAHEWVHNFLTLRPLGASYMASPQLRIMNETAANIAGKEIGQVVLERFYPELLPPPAPEATETPAAPQPTPEPPAFDYYDEMRETRVTVDELLAQGKIEEAEAYMEQRRQVFWDHGYRHLRKLNQAYFAFHGAYADHPGGGAAGKDVVGAAVRQLRAQSTTLAEFINRISWMWSFDQLQAAVGQSPE